MIDRAMINGDIIFKAVVGSQSYGTATPTSNIDYKGIYIQDIYEVGSFIYREQVDKNKDEVYFEVKRFLQLCATGNHTMLELLFSPLDCIKEVEHQYRFLYEHRQRFLTKRCGQSFGGYAVEQIKKARGTNKKMNWENEKVTRKGPLDFVYIELRGKTIPLKKYLGDRLMNQEDCGLVALDHMKDCYALYYDENPPTYKFKGLVLPDSTSLRLSSVPKEISPIGVIYYNKDGYTTHCKDYKDYEIWLKERNEQRYVDTKHGQKIDGKNMLHCRRLIETGMEIPTLKTIQVRRPNADYLLSIRRGEVDLEQLIEDAEKDIKIMDQLYKDSDLPDEVDMDFLNDLLIQVRKL